MKIVLEKKWFWERGLGPIDPCLMALRWAVLLGIILAHGIDG